MLLAVVVALVFWDVWISNTNGQEQTTTGEQTIVGEPICPFTLSCTPLSSLNDAVSDHVLSDIIGPAASCCQRCGCDVGCANRGDCCYYPP